MTRPAMTRSTVYAGAGVARSVGSELSAVGSRVSGMPIPEGVKGDVAGLLAAAGAMISRSGHAVASQSAWLTYRADMFALADGPGGRLFVPGVNDGGPRLLSPMPPPGQRKSFGKGLLAGAMDLAEGFARTGAAANMVNPLSKLMPRELTPFGKTQRRWERELREGLDWARRNPGEFAKAVGRDAVAYDDWKKGESDYALGKNTFALLELLVPVSKISKLGVAARASHRADVDVAVARLASNGRRHTQNLRHTDARTNQRALERATQQDVPAHVLRDIQRRADESQRAYDRATDLATEARERAVRARAEQAAANARMRQAMQGVRDARPTAGSVTRDVLSGPIDPRGGMVGTHEALEIHRADEAERRRVDARNNR